MTFTTLAPVVRAVARPSRLVAAAQAAVLTLLVAGAAGWTMFDRTVTLEVDGQAQQVRILGSQVSDVLAAADLEVGARDLVSPAVDETVADGETVVVRYARQLTVTEPSGSERTFWTTGAHGRRGARGRRPAHRGRLAVHVPLGAHRPRRHRR